MGPYKRTPKKVARAIRCAGLGVRSVGPVGVFLDFNVCLFWGYYGWPTSFVWQTSQPNSTIFHSTSKSCFFFFEKTCTSQAFNLIRLERLLVEGPIWDSHPISCFESTTTLNPVAWGNPARFLCHLFTIHICTLQKEGFRKNHPAKTLGFPDATIFLEQFDSFSTWYHRSTGTQFHGFCEVEENHLSHTIHGTAIYRRYIYLHEWLIFIVNS